MEDETLLRADARQNRGKIIAAAEEVFSELGGAASLEAIAKRAGVGIGTLYRRFSTREELLAATYSDRLIGLADNCREEGTQLPELAALRLYVEQLVILINTYRGLASLIGTVLHSGTPGCMAVAELGRTLLTRAQECGDVRNDVAFDDLVCVITAVSLSIDQRNLTNAAIGHLVDIFFGGMQCRR